MRQFLKFPCFIPAGALGIVHSHWIESEIWEHLIVFLGFARIAWAGGSGLKQRRRQKSMAKDYEWLCNLVVL